MINRVNIFGQVYKIKLIKNLFLMDQKCDGYIDPVKKIIFIDKDLSIEDRKHTLIHEMVHGLIFRIFPTMGIEWTLNETLSEAIATMIVENLKVSFKSSKN